MKARLVITVIFLIMVWLSVATAEYQLVMCLGILFNVLISIFALSVLLAALLRAPEGYEDEDGFHVGALAGATMR